MNDPIQTADTIPPTDSSAFPAIALVAAVAAPVLLAGCGGGGGGGDPGPAPDTSPTLSITSIEVRGTTDTAGNPVLVNTNAQTDPNGITFALNGAIGGTQMPADPGRSAAARSYNFAVRQSGASGRNLTVTINPSPAMVIPAVGAPTYNRARHLLARTAFAPSWDDLTLLLGMDYNTAVDAMVDNTSKPPIQAPPDWIDTHILSWAEFDALPSQAAKDAYQDSKWQRRHAFKGWLMKECATTPNPFTERLTMFWANHFVVNIDDIEEPQLAWRWWKFLRDNCTGNFRTMAHAMARMPAMVLYLNSDTNTKVSPNENFARELMELFTLGEGQVYTEQDVVQVARAFTGYGVDPYRNWLYDQSDHDTGTGPTAITVLGTALTNAVPTLPPAVGALAGDQAIDLILEAGKVSTIPRTARLVVEKLWLEFIGTTPNPARVDYYAGLLYNGGWEIAPVLKAFFKDNDFTAAANVGTMLKNPIELLCGFYRGLGMSPPSNDWEGRAWRSSEEDQNVLCPPNVKGWLGGTTWINAKSLLARYQHLSWSQWEIGSTVSLSLRDGHVDLLLAKPSDREFAATSPPSWMSSDQRGQLSYLLRELIQDPAYQMK